MSLAIDAQIVIIAQSFQFFHLFRKGYFFKCFSIFNSNLTPYGDAIAKKRWEDHIWNFLLDIKNLFCLAVPL